MNKVLEPEGILRNPLTQTYPFIDYDCEEQTD